MLAFIISRVLQGIAVIFVVLLITFGLLKLSPSSPFNSERNVTPEVRAAQNAYYGLDKPWPAQLWRHVSGFATFNYPPSYKLKGRNVGEIIAQAFPVSVAIGAPALLIALGLGIPLGAMAALKPNTLEDRAATVASTIGICMPSLVLGPLLALVFGLKLKWFNVSGWFDADDWVLPALTLGLIYGAYVARLTRGGLRETLAQDFIRTARAKGASEPAVVVRHSLKLACLPLLNFLGPATAGLLTGSFVVENVFQVPGLGQHFVSSATNGDHPLAMGTAAFYALLIVAFNLLVDIAQAMLNPRIGLKT